MSRRVSVVVPVRDEEKNIGRLLESLLAQTRKPDEIIVVDGGSRDRTVKIVRAHVGQSKRVRLICADQAYPGQARNMGVSHAAGDVIAFWDGGMVPQERALEHLTAPILAGRADVSYGRLIFQPGGFVDRCYALTLVPAWNVERNGRRFNAAPVANSAIRKDLWEAVGGFSPWRAGEDIEFREKVAALSPRVAYDPEAVAVFCPGERFDTLTRKLVTYSRHNLLAARGTRWHLGLARLYGITLVGAVVLAILSHLALFSAFMLFVMLQLVLRVFRNAWQKQAYLPFSPWAFSTILGSLFLLVCADLATLAGALEWFFGDKLRMAPEPFREPSALGIVPKGKS